MKLCAAFVVVVAFLLTCIFLWPEYSYGVKIKTSDIIVPPYFPSQFSRDYDFHTVLFLKDSYATRDIKWAQHQAYSLIYIDHLTLSRPDPNDTLAEDKGNLQASILYFNNLDNFHDLKITHISITHFNKDGREILPSFPDNSLQMTALENCIHDNKRECTYERFYNPDDLPDQLIEKIDIQFSHAGKEHHLQKTFLIEKKLYSNMWRDFIDAMMSV